MSDSIAPAALVEDLVSAATRKVQLPVIDMALRGLLSGAILGIATSLVFTSLSQGLPPLVGAIIFPVGFVMLVLLGLELVTGNFAVLPMGLYREQIAPRAMLRSWLWVYLGNLAGSLLYAGLYWAVISTFGTTDGGAVGDIVRKAALTKTQGYATHSMLGWLTAMTKAILCNWMVTMGTVLAFSSRSTAGRVVAMWLPITVFFAHGYEHAVVNMFVIPAGILFDAPVSLSDWWWWNQIPVTLGNLVGGVLLTGLPLAYTYRNSAPTAQLPPRP